MYLVINEAAAKVVTATSISNAQTLINHYSRVSSGWKIVPVKSAALTETA